MNKQKKQRSRAEDIKFWVRMWSMLDYFEKRKEINEERKKALNTIFEHLKDTLREYYDLLDDDEQAASQHIGAAVAILAEYLDELDEIE